jgi:hypothetical protein
MRLPYLIHISYLLLRHPFQSLELNLNSFIRLVQKKVKGNPYFVGKMTCVNIPDDSSRGHAKLPHSE